MWGREYLRVGQEHFWATWLKQNWHLWERGWVFEANRDLHQCFFLKEGLSVFWQQQQMQQNRIWWIQCKSREECTSPEESVYVQFSCNQQNWVFLYIIKKFIDEIYSQMAKLSDQNDHIATAKKIWWLQENCTYTCLALAEETWILSSTLPCVISRVSRKLPPECKRLAVRQRATEDDDDESEPCCRPLPNILRRWTTVGEGQALKHSTVWGSRLIRKRNIYTN